MSNIWSRHPYGIQGIKPEYETFIQCLTINKKPDELKLDSIIDTLFKEEIRKNESKNNQESKDELVFYNKEEKSRKCYHCNKLGHVARNCRSNKHRDKTCQKCNKMEHISGECRTKTQQVDDRANTVSESNEENSKQVISHLSNKENELKGVWLLDSGASSHVCCSKEFYKSIEPNNS